jgi:hypothetical protein
LGAKPVGGLAPFKKGNIMASVLEIYQNALILLGQTPVQSEDEDSDIAFILACRYPMLRNRLLGQYHWRFTYKQVQLSKDPVAPVARYSNRYPLPADSLNAGVLAVYQSSDENAPPYQDYKIQDGYLLTNADTIFVEYKYPPPVENFPDHFVDLVAHMLASDCATSITDDSTLTTRIDVNTKALLQNAITLDSQSGPSNNRIRNFQLITVRRSGNGII